MYCITIDNTCFVRCRFDFCTPCQIKPQRIHNDIYFVFNPSSQCTVQTRSIKHINQFKFSATNIVHYIYNRQPLLRPVQHTIIDIIPFLDFAFGKKFQRWLDLSGTVTMFLWTTSWICLFGWVH